MEGHISHFMILDAEEMRFVMSVNIHIGLLTSSSSSEHAFRF